MDGVDLVNFKMTLSLSVSSCYSFILSLSVNLYIKMCCLSRSRTFTRGSNKGAKEDLKSSLAKQVTRASESIESILRLFFIEEKNSLI